MHGPTSSPRDVHIGPIHTKIYVNDYDLLTIVYGLWKFYSDSYGRFSVNPLDSKCNYSATSNNTKLVHRPLMGGPLHMVQRGGAWARARAPPSPLLVVSNVTTHPSTASVPISHCIALWWSVALCGFNMAIKELILVTNKLTQPKIIARRAGDVINKYLYYVDCYMNKQINT